MIRDPIVEAVRESRRRTEQACGNDWKRLAEHYRRVALDGHRVIRRAPRRLSREPVIHTPP